MNTYIHKEGEWVNGAGSRTIMGSNARLLREFCDKTGQIFMLDLNSQITISGARRIRIVATNLIWQWLSERV